MELSQCGVPVGRRFTFFDQVCSIFFNSRLSKLACVFCLFSPFFSRFCISSFFKVHTTGMDIKQEVNAHAVVTLGKDMTFRGEPDCPL